MLSFTQWHERQSVGCDKVSVRNLRTTANAGFDAWGRSGKTQPVEITVTLHLAKPFSTAASSDEIDRSTVHYGLLSKALLARVQSTTSSDSTGEELWESPGQFNASLLGAILSSISHQDVISAVELQIRYPKAAHLAAGGIVISHRQIGLNLERWSSNASEELRIDRCQVPVLIGVNSHERGAKQMVLISVTLDRAGRLFDISFALEQLVLKTTEESAFMTLEALAEELAVRVVKFFVIADLPASGPPVVAATAAAAGSLVGDTAPVPRSVWSNVVITIEKPSAVPMADAPVVEVCRSADPEGEFGKRVFAELGSKRVIVPFPLAGRLDEFLGAWKQD